MRSIIDFFYKNPFFERIKKLSTRSDIIIGLIISSLFINILSLAFPIMLLQIYDRIIPNVAIYTLISLTIAVIIALSLEVILKTLRSWINLWIDARFEHNTNYEMFSKMLNAKTKNYDQSGIGFYLECFNCIRTLKDFYSNQLIVSLLDLPFILIFIGLVYYIGNYLVLIPLLFCGLMILFIKTFNQKLYDHVHAKRESDDKRINFIIAALTGIHSIKSMALEMQMLRRYERIQEITCHHDHKLSLNNAMASLISNNMTQFATVLILIFGANMVIHANLTIGGLAACVLLTNRILQPISRITGVFSKFQNVQVAQKRLQKIEHLPQENIQALSDIPIIKGEIVLTDVYFHYDDQTTLLEGINLTIKTGEIIGIDSASLSGKTSLLWLIMGVLQPLAGKICIDGQDINQFNPQSLREQIAYIPQKSTLFNGTIMENITLFRTSLIDKAKNITAEIGLDADIHKLPKGYETSIGKLSVELLSQGFRQRIAIARAMIDEPRIILFDEANSMIDSHSDTLLKSIFKLQRGHRTIILVMKTPDLTKLADKIFSINDGKLIEVITS